MFLKTEILNDIKEEPNETTELYEVDVKIEDDLVIEDEVLQKVIQEYNHLYYEPNADFVCFFCHKHFQSRNDVLQHNLTHVTISSKKLIYFFCHYCPKYFNEKFSLVEHIMIKHTSKRSKKLGTCKICKKEFKHIYLSDHMRTVHHQGQVQCDVCNKVFGCKKYMKNHKKNVHNVKCKLENGMVEPVECTLCLKKFKSKDALKTHMRHCHSTSTSCKVCGSILKCHAYLKAHMNRVHYNDGKQHCCDICGKSFRSPRYLKVHKKNAHSLKAKIKFERPKFKEDKNVLSEL
ncbi:unnamed protein product [Leptidea sinapis]|uniref:C2H2-type domain-containing protein n=1 Tax=Leptidea sinapis TaxID=189913 RepID=A0A5E4R335_9NEOP|nr:unnamed protein product [Leptidea sinapis]